MKGFPLQSPSEIPNSFGLLSLNARYIKAAEVVWQIGVGEASSEHAGPCVKELVMIKGFIIEPVKTSARE